ncbi:MAG TPA: polymer-forming cytoskeletal protein [Spirochaetia bacterium]|nr:polymer-forming cytoskeletal protein [Spirochaetia bacterium]HTZ52508.1 polymer-forming cytoskeletal protein [Spirochaetia bacterium]
MAKSDDHKTSERITTTLGRETDFNGVMRFKDSLKIDGTFSGEIVSTGFLYVEQGATITANIRVGSVVIGGTVKGNIEATEKLEMLATGKVYGNIRTGKLKIADGVVFEGKCEMIRNPQAVNVFSGPVDQLKKNLQSV